MVCAAFGSENWEEGGGSSFTDDGGKEGWCCVWLCLVCRYITEVFLLSPSSMVEVATNKCPA